MPRVNPRTCSYIKAAKPFAGISFHLGFNKSSVKITTCDGWGKVITVDCFLVTAKTFNNKPSVNMKVGQGSIETQLVYTFERAKRWTLIESLCKGKCVLSFREGFELKLFLIDGPYNPIFTVRSLS